MTVVIDIRPFQGLRHRNWKIVGMLPTLLHESLSGTLHTSFSARFFVHSIYFFESNFFPVLALVI